MLTLAEHVVLASWSYFIAHGVLWACRGFEVVR